MHERKLSGESLSSCLSILDDHIRKCVWESGEENLELNVVKVSSLSEVRDSYQTVILPNHNEYCLCMSLIIKYYGNVNYVFVAA